MAVKKRSYTTSSYFITFENWSSVPSQREKYEPHAEISRVWHITSSRASLHSTFLDRPPGTIPPSGKCGKSQRPILTGVFVSFDSHLLPAVNRNRRIGLRGTSDVFFPTTGRGLRGSRGTDAVREIETASIILQLEAAASKKSRDDVVPQPCSREDGSRFTD